MYQGKSRIFLIINAHAGYKQGNRIAENAMSFLRKNGYEVDFSFTRKPGHATELASLASDDGYDLVVAVGGDGTVNEVARGLMGTTTPMGIIPVGSGNGLARDLGISTNLHKCCQTLMTGSNILLDICRVNDHYFFSTGGIGFNARIAEEMARATSRGFLKYVQLVIRESLFYKPFHIRLTIDGETVEKSVFMVTFANSSQFGNNVFIAPSASMTDGLIDVVMICSFTKILFPVAAFSLFSKWITKLPFVNCIRAKSIILEAADSPSFHYDGEPGKITTPAYITIDAEKLSVKCPCSTELSA